jgi:hypothetical protein
MKLITLLDSLDTKLPVKWEQKNPQLIIGYFSVDERDYKIVLDYYDISELKTEIEKMITCNFEGKNKSQTEYTYYGVKSENLAHSSKVFGTIINSVSDKITLNNNTLLVFSAKDNDNSFLSRKKLYSTLSKKISKKLNIYLNTIEEKTYVAYVFSKKDIPNKLIYDIIKIHNLDCLNNQ